MSSDINNQTFIKPPAPSVKGVNSGAKNDVEKNDNSSPKETIKRKNYNRPNVGVITPGNLTRTPITDTLQIKQKENPKMTYKYIPPVKIKNTFQHLTSVGVFVLGTIAAFLTFKKK